MLEYGFSTAALYPRDNADCLDLIAKAGFDCAELMPQCFRDASPEFASIAERSGLRIRSVHYPLAMFGMLYNANPTMGREARAFGRGLVELCRRLGASVLVVHPHETCSQAIWRELLERPIIDNLSDLAEACDGHGLILGMENNPKGQGRTAAGLLEYIASLRAGNIVRPVVDTTEACESDQDPVGFIRIAKPSHVHLSDYRADAKHIPAGEGDVDWLGVRAALRAVEYEGAYMLEPMHRYYYADAETSLRKAREFIGELIEG